MEYDDIEGQNKRDIYQKLLSECKNSKIGLKLKRHDIIQIAAQQKWTDQSSFGNDKFDFLQFFEIEESSADSFYVIVPWTGKHHYPFELVSACTGNLPQAVALIQGAFGLKWSTSDDAKNEAFFKLLAKSSAKLGKKIKWEFQKGAMDFKMKLQWGLQAAPLKDGQFLFQFQTSSNQGVFSSLAFNLDLFVEKRAMFAAIVDEINYMGKNESFVVFPSTSLIVISKGIPDLHKLFPGASETVEVEESFITEFEYSELLNSFADDVVQIINEKKVELDEAISQVLANRDGIMKQFVNYQVHTIGGHNEDKVAQLVDKDVNAKIQERITGLDESDYQSYGMWALGVSVILIAVIWTFVPEGIHWGIKLGLSIAAFIVCFVAMSKMMDRKIQENQAQ